MPEMKQTCPRCKTIAPAGSNFCNACGIKLSGTTNKPNNSLTNPVIILLTVISFCSICGLCGLLGNITDKSDRSNIASSRIDPAQTTAIRPLVSIETTDSNTESEKTKVAGSKDSKPDNYKNNGLVITENANLREAADTNGVVIQTIPEGSEIEIIRQKGVWFYVGYSGQKGWMHGNTIKYTNPEAPKVPGISTKSVSRPSPVYKAPERNVNPSGATAKCRDGTLSFSASRRGTCSHHGGVAIWY